ncbi:1491_t:CDS:1, partial [Scutellospora calospora]
MPKAKLLNTENKTPTPKINKLQTKEEKSRTGFEKVVDKERKDTYKEN